MRVFLFLPGDYRAIPNELAWPNVETFVAALTAALQRLGHDPVVLDHFLSTPADAIDTLSGIEDPMIGVYAHWVYGPHTTEGVVGSDTPLLLASNFDGTWPGLVGLLNTGVCLTSLGRAHSRLWSEASDLTTDKWFMDALDTWVRAGTIEHDTGCIKAAPAPIESSVVEGVLAGMRAKRPLAAMLGDTSMGMINGYFGPQRLARVGFSEHKIDQAWVIEQGKTVDGRRVDDALAFVRDRGVEFHYGDDFDEQATRNQLRDYCAALDLLGEFRADCLGWQYQLGLIRSLPPSDFAEGLLNSACRPETSGSTIATATEADQGNLLPMEMLKRLLLAHGLHESVVFHDVRFGGEYDGRFIWVLLNSGSAGAYAFNHDPDTLRGVHSYRQPPRTSRSPVARSRARACRARSRGPARGSTARSSSWTSAAERSSRSRRRCATSGGRARRGSGRSWPPTCRSAATTSWRTTRAITWRSRTATCSPTWPSCRAGSGSASVSSHARERVSRGG